MHWYAISTKPHQERQAEANLSQLGVETFLPLLKQQKVIRRVRKTVVGPLFPGYLFARFNLTEHYRAVSYARGVRNVVTFGLRPAVVDEALIEGIKARMTEGYVSIEPERFRQGQLVRVDDGPLAGLEAVFVRALPDKERAVLLLRALAYSARVVVRTDVIGLPVPA